MDSKKKASAKAKVEKLKAISQKAESKVAELKNASSKAKTKVKTKVEEIKKTVAKNAAVKSSALKKTVASKVSSAAEKVEKSVSKVAAKAKAAEKVVEKAAVKAEKSSEKAVEKVVAKAQKAAKPATKTAKVVKAAKAEKSAEELSPEYLALMQRDPNFLHAFWDVKKEHLEKTLEDGDVLVLRLYDVSSDLTVRKNKKRKFEEKFREIEVPADAKSWYVQNREAVSFRATLGAKTQAGEFKPLVEAPAMQVFSYDAVKNSAKNSDSVFFKASLGSAGIGGFGSSGLSSQTVASWLEHLASSSESFFSGSISSGSILSSGELAKQALQPSPDTVNYGKDFFLWVKTRLIVYGGTRPDAHLQVRGEPFPLNPDGTFSFEQDLPDSTQIIPVFATDKDGDFPTTIVPIVVKRTE
ncbi:MAG: DUF4912 domain-containing protein [Hallerella porci]|uniref:DUF4912 domain-containing protein n=1 Tax=Hallerella porci TaxID=1945871 RepID=A0ABX5LQC3_9BACT|nr:MULTISPECIES: DUF4912 domain-containing protein [Hallerella]MCI5600767.1 DUF4912 domain-containing protein [Hallerella sp.]MDY3920915.1 DUF4912 domain-containing protein [Hallerella porci]PWL04109.1 hypothetical protein B0H50_101120 [Hallerella porci]